MSRSILQRLPASIAFGSGRALTVAIEFGTTIYLMRLLGPEPFGLVAMATGLIVAFGVFGDAGAGSSLVSDRHPSSSRVGSASLIAFAIGTTAMLVALACTPLVVHFYGEKRLTMIWVIVCLTIWISAMSSVPNSLAQRQQRFWLMAWAPFFGTAGASVVALLLTRVLQNYWPIVVFQVMGSALCFAAMWLLVRPKLGWPSKQDIREVFHFGRGLVGFDLLNVLNRYADKVIIGFFLGTQALGFYQLAYKVLMIPLREIGSVINSLAYPRLSSLAPNWKQVGLGLSHVMRDVAMFTTPISLGIALAAPEIITVVFGTAWMGALVPLQVLALLGVVQAPFTQIGLAFTVSRNTDEMARWGMLSTPAIVLSFLAGIPWGIEGVAIAYSATFIALLIPMMRIGASVLGVSPWLLATGGFGGIGIGAVVALPLIGTYFMAKALGYNDFTVLVSTILVGALSEATLYFFAMRSRRITPAAW